MKVDNEISGALNGYTTEFRQYDARLGRWLSRDAKESKYPGISTYNYSLNNPIIFKDIDGKDARITIEGNTITIQSTIFLYGKDVKYISEDHINKLIGNLNNSREITDPNTGKTYIVKIDVTFVKVESQDLIPVDATIYDNANTILTEDSKKSLGFQNGDNILNVDDSKFVNKKEKGWTFIGNNIAESSSNVYDIIHEVFHDLGYDERYRLIKRGKYTFSQDHEGYSGDVLSTSGSSDININQIHFIDLLNFALKNGEGIYGWPKLKIDDTESGNKEESEKTNNKNKVDDE
jgi:RHS repeat-associated protein